MTVGATFVCGLTLFDFLAVDEYGEASECRWLGENKDSSQQLCTQPRPSASRKKAVKHGVLSWSEYCKLFRSVYIISSPALIILFVRLPEKEGVRRMYRSQSNKMISQSSGSLVSSLEEDGDAVVEDLAERFAAMVLLAFVFTAAVFFFAFLTSFSFSLQS